MRRVNVKGVHVRHGECPANGNRPDIFWINADEGGNVEVSDVLHSYLNKEQTKTHTKTHCY